MQQNIKTEIGQNTTNYKPNNNLAPLPPYLDIETKTILRKTIAANRALADLKNKADHLTNQDILISSIVLTEARDSSEIENIVTTADLLYKSGITPEIQLDANTKEVRSYNRALWQGMKMIDERPLSTNVFINIVQEIKQNTAGIRTIPGTVLKNPVTGEVVYTPPNGENVIRDKLKNLEDFLYLPQYAEIDPLIKMAVMHYQFEAIHPFADGNGRTGRIINILWLVQEKLLNRPILFLSKYFLNHREEYYNGLRNVTSHNEWEKWILYVLDAVEQTARNTGELIDKITAARKECKDELQSYFPKIYSLDLVETIFSTPYFRMEDYLQKNPTISRQTASKYLHQLCKPYKRTDNITTQILKIYRQGRENIFFNQTMFDILSSI
jgi:Fic family protein